MNRLSLAVLALLGLAQPCRAQLPVEIVGEEWICSPEPGADIAQACPRLPQAQPLPLAETPYSDAKGFGHREIVPGNDDEWGLGHYVFGASTGRPGAPYLAFAPRNTLQMPQRWKFFTGRGLSASVNWVEFERWQNHIAGDGAWDPGDHAKLFSESRTCGRFQVEWNPQLARFLMLYGCNDDDIYVRVAQRASGPWSEAVLFRTAVGGGTPRLLAAYDAVGPAQPGSRTAIVTWEALGSGGRREIHRTTLRQQGVE